MERSLTVFTVPGNLAWTRWSSVGFPPGAAIRADFSAPSNPLILLVRDSGAKIISYG